VKVLIAVTHLLGTGHLSRALTLARAFGAGDHDARLISGGMAAPHLNHAGVSVVQLPPLRSDGTNFTRLLDGSGLPATDALLSSRIAMLRETLARFQPDILVTELYPFGRRILGDEFTALLDSAHAMPRRPVIFSSIRDILAPPSKPEKAARTDAVIAQYYDGVLVHSDPAATTLDQSWPVSAALADRLFYTGYVAPPEPVPHPDGVGEGEVLVSAGGGAVGRDLYRVAIQAAQRLPDRNWRMLVGGADSAAHIAALQAWAQGSDNITIEPVRPDFRQMLRGAAASVSMCGYNTTLDLLQTGTPAVLVPFDDGQEVEQSLRATALAALPAMITLQARNLSALTLSQAVEAAIQTGRRDVSALRFDGAEETVRLACAMAEARK